MRKLSENPTKITMIGAGSFSFGLESLKDLASMSMQKDSPLKEAEVMLMDIDEFRLQKMMELWKKMAELQPEVKLKVSASTDRKKALSNAKYVISAINPGGRRAIQKDLEIPKKWMDKIGIPAHPNTSDTINAGGIMRGLRTVPIFMDIINDMAEKCEPGALMMNYSNPMAINTWGMYDWIERNYYDLHTIGLCHGTTGTAILFRLWCGVLPSEFSYTCAGINHMAWYTEMRMKDPDTGKWIDAYPILKENLKESPPTGDFHPETFRREILDQFGYFCTESSSHLSEYVPFPVRRRQDLWDKYRFDSEAPNNKKLGGASKWNPDEDKKHFERILENPRKFAIPNTPSTEYAPWIIDACESDADLNTGNPKTFLVAGNIKNENLITNLPYGCCVEVPCIATNDGWGQNGPIIPTFQGELPPQCAALCMTNINVQTLVMKAVQTKDLEYARYAMMMDPLISQALEPAEARAMADEIFEAEKEWLGFYN